MHELLGDTAYHALQPYIDQALSGNAVEFERQIAYRGAGMRDVVVAYLPDVSPQGTVRGFYVMVTDISRTKESERRERRHMLELAHVSRLSSMGEMATEIAHEINQPLAAISMYCAAGLRVLQDGGDQGQIKTWLDAINTQTSRASEIVRRVRRFVQKQELQYAPVDLSHTATEVAALLEHEAKSQQVEIVLKLAEDLPPVHGEHVLLEQVVFNLARNAMDEVVSQSGERRIILRTSYDAQQVHVEVSDNGRGVDAALAEHIFDSFITGKEGGLGLGLSISRSIVEAHGGVLRYAANPGGGSTFMFSLDRADRR
jgi:C4-dicarboxylate-specific signal transduction histidine kinase